jgi:hypothetical protein
MKPEIRIIAWDDCAFTKRSRKVRIIGAIFRGGSFMDGVLSTEIEVDGLDATEKITESITNSRHYDQLSYVMLNGITLGGLNLVDIKKLHKKTGLPVIVVQRKKPNKKEFGLTLKIFSDYKKRLNIVKNAGKFCKWRKLYYQKAGMTKTAVEQILEITCTRSLIPEPLRVAHLIASGLSGESRGRA